MPGRRICFVTCATWPEISESDSHVERALSARGVAVSAVPWNDPDGHLDGFDAAIFRSDGIATGPPATRASP